MKAVRSIWRTEAPVALIVIGAVAWLAFAVSAGAQTAAPSKAAPAKSAKPATKKATAQQLENFKKAFSVCLEAKKYMVKY